MELKDKPIEVEAEVIEDKELSVTFVPASIKANFARLDAQVEKMIAGYADITYDLTSPEAIKQAKRDRAYINGIVKDIDTKRKAVKRDYMLPYNEFEGQANAITAKAKKASDNIKRQLDQAEDDRKADLHAVLKEHYEAFAGVLVELIPYERIHDAQWLNKTFGEVKAKNVIEEKVEKIASDWDTLKTQKDTPHYDTAERTFFETLDLGAALSEARKAQEADELIAELRKETEAIKEAQSEQPIPEEAPPAPPVVAKEQAEPSAPMAPIQPERIPCVMIIQAASTEQMRQIGKFCGSLEPKVVGRFIGGTIDQAYAKICQEASSRYAY